MKTLLSTALLALTVSTSVQAETSVIYSSNVISVIEATDDFTGEISTCQITLRKDKVRMQIFTTGRGKFLHKMAGDAGHLGASGIKYKIDKKEVFQVGATYPSGDAIYPVVPTNLLDDIAKGGSMVIEMVPGNQFGDTKRTKFKLADSSTAIAAYLECADRHQQSML